MAEYEGYITLGINIDTDGFKDGKINIDKFAKSLDDRMKQTSMTIARAMDIGNVKVAESATRFKNATAEVEKQAKKVDELRQKLSALESGGANPQTKATEKLQREFDKTTESIKKAEAETDVLHMKLDTLYSGAFEDPVTKKPILTPSEQREAEKLCTKLDELTTKLHENKSKAEELEEALKSAMGTATQAEIDKTKKDISEAGDKLDSLAQKAEIAGTKLQKEMKKPQKTMKKLDSSFGKFNKRLLQIAKTALVYNLITKGFNSIREAVTSAMMSNNEFRDSVNQLQASLWVVAEPIYQTILPAVKQLVDWLTKGSLYIAAFFSAMSGKSLKDTIKNAKALQEQAKAYEDIADNAKEAKKQIASFDELSILADNSKITTGTLGESFDSLESFIESEDMQNLREFEKWVRDNKDSIKTALEVAGVVGLGAAIFDVGKKIVTLLGWFGLKDRALDRQTKKTKTESDAVEDLAWEYAYATDMVGEATGAFDGLTNQWGLTTFPAADDLKSKMGGLSGELGAVKLEADMASAMFENDFAPALERSKNESKSLADEVEAVQGEFESVVDAFEKKLPILEQQVATSFQKMREEIRLATDELINYKDWLDMVMEAGGEAPAGDFSPSLPKVSTMQEHAPEQSMQVASNFIRDNQPIPSEIFDAVKNSPPASPTDIIAEAMVRFMTQRNGVAEGFNGLLPSITWEDFGEAWKKSFKQISSFLSLAGGMLVPGLARGAVLPANKPFLAMVGDQKHGTNVETPLATMIEAFNIALDSRGGDFGGTVEVPLVIGGREFGRASIKWSDIERQRTSGNRATRTKVVFGK